MTTPPLTKRDEIAKLLVDLARVGANHSQGKHGKMCNTCAFRPDTEANKDVIVYDAADCVSGCPHPFYCHENDHNKCVGYLYAMEVGENTNTNNIEHEKTYFNTAV